MNRTDLRYIEPKTKKIIRFCLAYYLCFILSLYNGYFVFACLAIGAYTILQFDSKYIFGFLLCIFSTATFLKFNSGSTSLFTFLEFFAVIILLFRNRKMNGRFIVLLFFLITELILPLPDWKEIIKLLNIILLYYYFVEDYNVDDAQYYKLSFVSGIACTTIIGFFKTRIPRMMSFYSGISGTTISGIVRTRFSGIFNDPNYFSIPVILCVTICLISLLYEKKLKAFWLIGFLFFTICGLLTISKSFFLLYCLAVFIIIATGENKSFVKRMILGLALLLIVLLFLPDSLLDNILYRFTMNKSGGDITTGRLEIWDRYYSVIKSSLGIMLFGDGIGGEYLNGQATHNTYLEVVYQIGIIGGILYFLCLIKCTILKLGTIPIKRIATNYIGYVLIIVAYAFLNGLTAFEFPFYLMICYIIFNYNLRDMDRQLYYNCQ